MSQHKKHLSVKSANDARQVGDLKLWLSQLTVAAKLYNGRPTLRVKPS